MATTYRLTRTRPRQRAAPELDSSQRAVVDHPEGPLLVLAGPGTGKTTTLVEAVVDRVERRELSPDQVLVLTFSRKAAEELRDRITVRLGRTTTTPLSSTFHAFCYALLRRQAGLEDGPRALRLLSAAEQDVRLRELLAGSRESGRVQWPPSLAAALRTRGLAEEVRATMARARELGLDPADVARAGRLADKPEWQALGAFFEEYLQVLDAEGVLDYSELITRAALLAERADVRRELRRQFAAVFVDEYQDTDPAQVRLLQAIAGDGRDLVVVGDPDQSIYAFRGADVRGISRFPVDFPRSDGRAAPVLPLTNTRRFGPELLAASRRIADGIGLPGSLDRDAVRSFRSPVPAEGPHGPGRLDVLTLATAGAELEHVADVLRRAHLQDGIDWSDMAVLVRSGTRHIPVLRRALQAAGVPVEVAGDELPLHSEPAVRALLLALRVAADRRTLTAEAAQGLLLSPLAGLDAADLRRLGRTLRDTDRSEFVDQRPPRPSAELLRDALVDPAALATRRGSVAKRVRRLAELLARAGQLVDAGEPPEEALWTLWSGTTWPQRLRAAVDSGGSAARAAHRDLDAVCALFDSAARAEQRRGHSGVVNFVEALLAQRIPGDACTERSVRGSAVRLLTAHRAKGLEWRLVVVAGVQEGVWPDLRRRGSVLEPDRLAREGAVPPLPRAALLAEERRLFYVSVTRARERLVVTAVESAEPDGEQPSRFLTELGVGVRRAAGRPPRPLSLSGLIAELRRVSADPGEPEPLRRAAAARLARLADATDVAGIAVAPQGDPVRWWGMAPLTQAPEPVRPAERPLELSGSAVSGLLECPLRWFLSREAAGEPQRPAAAGLGRVLHTLADDVARGHCEPEPEVLSKHLEQVWDQLPFQAVWLAERERRDAEAALERFAGWHRSRPHRRLVASEVKFAVLVPASGDNVVVRGAMDRVETDADGAVIVVDFKTGKSLPPAKQIAEHPQLGIYQLAVAGGALADRAAPDVRLGGAELVHLRHDCRGLPKVQQQPALALRPDGRTLPEQQLATVAAAVRAEAFPARPSPACRTCPFTRLCPAAATSASVVC